MTQGCRRQHRSIALVGMLGLLAALVFVLPGSAVATTTPNRCGKIKAHHRTYAVRGHLTKCSSARPVAKNYLRHGIKPRGWSCLRYPPRETSIAFTCRKGLKDIYAIRR